METVKPTSLQLSEAEAHRPPCFWVRSLVFAVACLALADGTLGAAQVRLREGTLVRLKLLYNVTTDNVARGDRVEFDVAEDLIVSDHVVISKGAPAWGQVVEVKGAGKKSAKDASVTFRLMAVKMVDNQQVPLRVMPTKPKKSDSADNDIVEDSVIPGMEERTIGAARGRDYAAYTDAEVLVSVPDAPLGAQGGGAAGLRGPASAAALPNPEPAPPPPVEDAYVDFNSAPSGGDVMVDNRFRGNTPLKITLPPGRHLIEIRLAGHRPWIRNMMVDPGSKPSVRAALDQE
jgi:hypothetical protein